MNFRNSSQMEHPNSAALIYCILTVLFGLSQIWIMSAYVFLDKNQTMDLTGLVTNCSFLFFSSSVVASLSVDFFFSQDTMYRTHRVGVVYVLFPLGVIVWTAIVFCVCYTGDPEFTTVCLAQFVCFVSALAYAFTIKRINFTDSDFFKQEP